MNSIKDSALSVADRQDLAVIAGTMVPADATLGIPGADDPAILADMEKSIGRDLPLIRKPAIYISGQSTDVAFRNADDDYARIEGAPVVRAWLAGSGHGGTYREALGGSYGQVAVAWLRWQLKGDAKAGAEFTGATCGLCAKPGWNVRRKGLD